jgi:SNF family Na+-dependent transporter
MIFILGLVLLVLSCVPAMLSNYLNSFGLLKRSLIELFDLSLIQFLLPIVVLLLIRKILVFTKKSDFKEAFDASLLNNTPISYEQWLFLIKFICPILIVLGLVLQVVEFFL